MRICLLVGLTLCAAVAGVLTLGQRGVEAQEKKVKFQLYQVKVQRTYGVGAGLKPDEMATTPTEEELLDWPLAEELKIGCKGSWYELEAVQILEGVPGTVEEGQTVTLMAKADCTVTLKEASNNLYTGLHAFSFQPVDKTLDTTPAGGYQFNAVKQFSETVGGEGFRIIQKDGRRQASFSMLMRSGAKGQIYTSLVSEFVYREQLPGDKTPVKPPAGSDDPNSIFGVWESDWGLITLAGSNAKITGNWNQGPEKQGKITGGTYDPATRKLVFTYYQDWNKATGTATLTLNAKGDELSGTWSQTYEGGESPGTGIWTIKLKERRPPGPLTSSPGQSGGTLGPAGGTPAADGMVIVAPDLIVPKGTTVPVQVSLLRAKNVRNLKFVLTYTPDVVTGAAEIDRGNLLSSISRANLNAPGQYTMDFAQEQGSPINGDGTVAIFRFDATGPARSRTPLKLTVERVDDPNRAELAIRIQDGSITIYDPNDLTDPVNPLNPKPPGGGTGLQPTCSGTGEQSMADAICCLEVSVGLKKPPEAYRQMDLNRDRTVDSGDAVIIMDNISRRFNR